MQRVMPQAMQGPGQIRCQDCGTDNEGVAIYCKNCGRKLAAQQRRCPACSAAVPHYTVAMCPSCGAMLNSTPVQPLQKNVSTQPQTNQAEPSSGHIMNMPSSVPRAPETAANDTEVFRKLKLFGIIGMAEAALGLLIVFSGNLLILMTPGSAGIHSAGSAIIADIIILMAELAISVYSIVVVRSAFRLLSSTDRSFSTPASLLTVLIIGLIIIFPAIIGIFVAGNGISLSALSIGVVLIFGFMVITALVLLILGVIGLLIGLWRVGTRYNESLFKIAAIFYLIPFLGIVSSILIYASSSSILKQRKNRPGWPGM